MSGSHHFGRRVKTCSFMLYSSICKTFHRSRTFSSHKNLTCNEIRIDRSALYNVEQNNSKNESVTTSSIKEILTPLARELQSYIKLKGPLTLHEFITQASNNKTHGYYQNETDKIGSTGDFVTSPEISQLFGEMISLWCVSVWELMGCPKEVNLVELGPGNGTLMADILRTGSRFPVFKKALRVHLVFEYSFTYCYAYQI